MFTKLLSVLTPNMRKNMEMFHYFTKYMTINAVLSPNPGISINISTLANKLDITAIKVTIEIGSHLGKATFNGVACNKRVSENNRH